MAVTKEIFDQAKNGANFGWYQYKPGDSLSSMQKAYNITVKNNGAAPLTPVSGAGGLTQAQFEDAKAGANYGWYNYKPGDTFETMKNAYDITVKNHGAAPLTPAVPAPGSAPAPVPASPTGVGSTPAPAPAAQAPDVVAPGQSLSTASDVINTGFDVAKAGATQGNVLTNANQKNAFGSSTVTIDPVTGQPTYTETLSDPNARALEGIQGNAVKSSDVLGSMLGGGIFGSLTNPSGDGGPAPMSNYENAIFKRLTQGVDQDETRDTQQLEQKLYNRGIPLGSDLYNDEMRRLRESYGTRRDSARAQAVEQGTTTGLQTLPVLGNLGSTGFQAPQLQPFQSVDYAPPATSDIFNTLTGKDVAAAGDANSMAIAKMQADLEQKKIDAANKGRSGGGGGGSRQAAQPAPDNPFGSGAYPGSGG